MPASNPRVLQKAKTIPADGFIFDLEDAVAPDLKEAARLAAVAAAGMSAITHFKTPSVPNSEISKFD